MAIKQTDIVVECHGIVGDNDHASYDGQQGDYRETVKYKDAHRVKRSKDKYFETEHCGKQRK